MTMVLTSTGSVALANESRGLIIAPSKQQTNTVSKEEISKNVLNVTKKMTDEKGVLKLENNTWDSINIPRNIEAKKVVLDNVTVDDVIIEGGTTCTFEVNNSEIENIEVTAPQMEVMDIAKIKELLAEGEDPSVVAELNRQYLSQKNLFNTIRPKITFGAGTQIKTVKMSGNANLNFSSNVKVENVEIKITDAQKKLNIALTGYQGNVSIAEDKNDKDTGKNLLKLDLKNSQVKELKMDGSKQNSYSINSKGNSKVENLEVKGSSSISLDVATNNITLDKNSEGAALKVYSVIETIVIEGVKNEIILSNNAIVGNAQVSGDNTKIYGNGKLESAEITGNGANVSTSGTAVNGTNDKTPPENVTNPSTPSKPSTPDKPIETPTPTPDEDKPTETPTPTPDDDDPTETPELPEHFVLNFEWSEEKDGSIVIEGFHEADVWTAASFRNDIEGYKVSGIKANAFAGESVLANVTIWDGLFIGNSAFEGCSALKMVYMDKTVTKIGSRAFARISAVEEKESIFEKITFSSDVTTETATSDSIIATDSALAAPETIIQIATDKVDGIAKDAFADCINKLVFYATETVAEFLEKIKAENDENWEINVYDFSEE